MKSFNKKNRTDFENTWSKALDNAEATPSPKVWQNINNELLHAEHIRIKGYYKIYKMIAAASVSLLFLAGTTFTFYYINDTNETSTSLTAEKAPQQSNKPEKSDIKKENNQSLKEDNKIKGEIVENRNQSSGNTQNKSLKTEAKTNDNNRKNETTILAQNTIVNPSKNNLKSTNNRIKQSANDAFYSLTSTNITKRSIVLLDNGKILVPPVLFNEEENKNAATPLANTAQNSVLSESIAEVKKVKRDRSKRFYADLNVLTDFFDPNIEIASPQTSAVIINQMSSISDEMSTQLLGQNNAAAMSFSYGINMGVKLSGKWIVEGGVSYANYNTQSSSNLTVADVNNGVTTPVTILNRPLIDNETFDATLLNLSNIYQVNNSFEFASIPVKAGYVIGIKRVNLILKAGVNTGLFLRNEISSNNENLDPYVNKPNDVESPFRRVHLNGLVSNEINYELSQNYSFSLAANYSFALNSLTKEGEMLNSMPDSYGVGMVFRYHFN